MYMHLIFIYLYIYIYIYIYICAQCHTQNSIMQRAGAISKTPSSTLTPGTLHTRTPPCKPELTLKPGVE